jgi:hypothetical protein
MVGSQSRWVAHHTASGAAVVGAAFRRVVTADLAIFPETVFERTGFPILRWKRPASATFGGPN